MGPWQQGRVEGGATVRTGLAQRGGGAGAEDRPCMGLEPPLRLALGRAHSGLRAASSVRCHRLQDNRWHREGHSCPKEVMGPGTGRSRQSPGQEPGAGDGTCGQPLWASVSSLTEWTWNSLAPPRGRAAMRTWREGTEARGL